MRLLQLHYGTNIKRIEELTKDKVIEYVDEPDEFNRIVFNLKDTTIEALIEEAQIMPMFSERKVVIVNDAFIFTGQKVRSEVKHDIDLLIEYMNEKNDDTLVIFNVFNDTLDKRKKITKIMDKSGEVNEIKPPSEAEIKQLIVDSLKDEGISIDRKAVQNMIDKTGIDYETVVNELDKLKLYVDDNVSSEDIDAVVSVSLEENIFKVTDLILQGKKVDAVHLVRQLILQKEEPIKLLSLITRQFRLLYQVKILKDEGFDQSYIAKALKSHPYPVKLAVNRLGSYPMTRLFNTMIKCRNVDHQMKSSYLDKNTLFETFILDL